MILRTRDKLFVFAVVNIYIYKCIHAHTYMYIQDAPKLYAKLIEERSKLYI